MNEFLRHLFETGHVSVAVFGSDAAVVGAEAVGTEQIFEVDRRERLEFPGDAPELFLPAARWAAMTFYTACQLLVCRDVPAAAVSEALANVGPGERSPQAHYSVDLVLRYLPDLLGSARRLAAGDALVHALERIALEWPLSSVGIPGLEPEDMAGIDTLIGHPGLRQLYADRIVQHDDTSRLGRPAVRASVLATLGLHADTLHPKFAALSDTADAAFFPAPHDL